MRKSILFALLTLTSGLLMAGDDLQEILKKHYEAMGGVEALENMDAVKVSAKVTMQSPQGQMQMPIQIRAKDDMVRYDISLQGMKITQAFDGEKGWQISPMMGETTPQDMSEEESKQFKRMAQSFTGLYGYEDRGDTVELVGTEDFEGAETYVLKITDADGQESFLYLDSEYYLPIRTKATTMQMGQEIESDITISDYKKVGDLMLAHSMLIKGPMGEMTTVMESFEINPELDDEIFQKPAVEESAETKDDQ